MKYSKEFCLMVDPKTGNPRLVEPSEDPEKNREGVFKTDQKAPQPYLGHGSAGI